MVLSVKGDKHFYINRSMKFIYGHRIGYSIYIKAH